MHVRRKFVDGLELAVAECDRVLKKIAELYALEERWRKLDPEERLAKRQKEARPVFNEFREMLVLFSQRLLPNHNLQNGLRYAINQLEPMELYLSDGAFQIDNNAVERLIRTIALGRKKFPFSESFGSMLLS